MGNFLAKSCRIELISLFLSPECSSDSPIYLILSYLLDAIEPSKSIFVFKDIFINKK